MGEMIIRQNPQYFDNVSVQLGDAYLSGRIEDANPTAKVAHTWVPSNTRTGIGTALYTEFEKLAKQNACNTVLLEVHHQNRPAQEFWEKLGFEYIEDADEAFWLYEKVLHRPERAGADTKQLLCTGQRQSVITQETLAI